LAQQGREVVVGEDVRLDQGAARRQQALAWHIGLGVEQEQEPAELA
jgi:hypothetical protein